MQVDCLSGLESENEKKRFLNNGKSIQESARIWYSRRV